LAAAAAAANTADDVCYKLLVIGTKDFMPAMLIAR
jgi:hypothetical protein